MKITSFTALIATLAITGVPFLAGFFSKDAILSYVFNSKLNPGFSNYLLYILLLITATMTAFYMFRWYYQIFRGEERLSEEAKEHVHESPALMTIPLVILAFFSIFAGYLGLPEFAFPNAFAHWLEFSIETPVSFKHPSLAVEWFLVLESIVAVALGLFAGFMIYHRRKGKLPERTRVLTKYAESALGFDKLYSTIFTKPSEKTASGFSTFDDSIVNKGIGRSVGIFAVLANMIRWLQTGYARQYALVMFVGVAIFALVVAFSGGLA